VKNHNITFFGPHDIKKDIDLKDNNVEKVVQKLSYYIRPNKPVEIEYLTKPSVIYEDKRGKSHNNNNNRNNNNNNKIDQSNPLHPGERRHNDPNFRPNTRPNINSNEEKQKLLKKELEDEACCDGCVLF
jgi:hypothetical protein